LDPPLRDGLRGGFLALENGRGPMSTTQIEKDSRRKAVNGVISSFQLEGEAITAKQVEGPLWPCQGCYAPRNPPVAPASIRPFGTVCAVASWLWRMDEALCQQHR
ncbi:hypothetical protein C9421_29945, partial [Klebsiella pneumoniae]